MKPAQSTFTERQDWMRILGLSPWPDVETLTHEAQAQPHEVVRGPETGLVMLRGRMGATGAAFNFGEATVTRCTVRLPDGTEGHSYILGRNRQHAHRAALCDALLQVQVTALKDSIATLQSKVTASRVVTASKAAATKVDFFTMVRGDD